MSTLKNKKSIILFEELLQAILKNDLDQLNILISKNVDINHVDDFGVVPLTLAAKLNRLEAVRILIKAGANIDFKNKQGVTAISSAKRRGYIEIVEELKKAGSKNDE